MVTVKAVKIHLNFRFKNDCFVRENDINCLRFINLNEIKKIETFISMFKTHYIQMLYGSLYFFKLNLLF